MFGEQTFAHLRTGFRQTRRVTQTIDWAMELLVPEERVAALSQETCTSVTAPQRHFSTPSIPAPLGFTGALHCLALRKACGCRILFAVCLLV